MSSPGGYNFYDGQSQQIEELDIVNSVFYNNETAPILEAITPNEKVHYHTEKTRLYMKQVRVIFRVGKEATEAVCSEDRNSEKIHRPSE